MNGGAKKLAQKDLRLHAKSEDKETKIRASTEAEATTFGDHR
jgi:hypothetical protein